MQSPRINAKERQKCNLSPETGLHRQHGKKKSGGQEDAKMLATPRHGVSNVKQGEQVAKRGFETVPSKDEKESKEGTPSLEKA